MPNQPATSGRWCTTAHKWNDLRPNISVTCFFQSNIYHMLVSTSLLRIAVQLVQLIISDYVREARLPLARFYKWDYQVAHSVALHI